MFYTALISSHHCSNDGNNKTFIAIHICSNYVFLLILVRLSSVTRTAPRPSWVRVTGHPMAFNVLSVKIAYWSLLRRNLVKPRWVSDFRFGSNVISSATNSNANAVTDAQLIGKIQNTVEFTLYLCNEFGPVCCSNIQLCALLWANPKAHSHFYFKHWYLRRISSSSWTRIIILLIISFNIIIGYFY